METEVLKLAGTTPGLTYEVAILHFGQRGASPKTYIQAGLHADEAPGMLAAHHLRLRLVELEAAGAIRGHVVLVPSANPIGLGQHLNGTHHGRFAFNDGMNFNRGYPDLMQKVGDAVKDRLTADAAANLELVRAALKGALAARHPVKPAECLKHLLLMQALDADIVLDLHCDGEGEVHLYILAGHEAAFQPLADFLQAKAMLVAEVSGDNPFDEAVSRPWRELALRFPGKPIPVGGMATTVELRGEADVSHEFARADAQAILDFLTTRGQLVLDHPPVPQPSCEPTPLAGSEALEAPVPGLVVYLCRTGQVITAGMTVAEIIDPATGAVTAVHATTSGVFYARHNMRLVLAGRSIGKIAGKTAFRHGNLLGA